MTRSHLRLSGRRGSNSPPIAWKAIALPNELLPHEMFTVQRLLFTVEKPTVNRQTVNFKERGQEWIRTTEVERQWIYSPPHLAALEPARLG